MTSHYTQEDIARLAKSTPRFSETEAYKTAQERIRAHHLARLQTQEKAALTLLQRFLGPSCPKDPADIIQVLDSRMLYAVKIIKPNQNTFAIIDLKTRNTLDSEPCP